MRRPPRRKVRISRVTHCTPKVTPLPRGLVIALLATCPLLGGPTCTPSDPGCGFEEACEGIANPARSCINYCAPLWNPSPTPEGSCDGMDDDLDAYVDEFCPPAGTTEAPSNCNSADDDADGATDEGCVPSTRYCALDPCDEGTATHPDTWLCPDGYLCQQDWLMGCLPGVECGAPPPGMGRCQIAELEFGTDCDPTTNEGARCTTGTFCASLEKSERAQEFVDAVGAENSLGGVCLTPVREGGLCDSNIGSLDDYLATSGPAGAACESGTICVLGEGEARCLRTCADEVGVPSNDFCSCGVSECIELESEVIDEATGESHGTHFCTPCDPTSSPCTNADAQGCCDPSASCENALVDVPSGRVTQLCCYPFGRTGCTVGADDECCPGTFCVDGTCRACGREGSDPELDCCPGYAVFRRNSTGAGSCGRCNRYGFDCGEDRFDIVHTDGTVDNFTIPNTEGIWYRGNLGAGGDLTTTEEGPEEAIYRISQQHRAYLFPGLLSAPPTDGPWSALLLPQSGGSESTIPLPASLDIPTERGVYRVSESKDEFVSFASARVYDVGACSYLLRWPMLVNVLAMEVNKALVNTQWGIFGAQPFTPATTNGSALNFWIRPLPSARPLLATLLPRGPLSEDDRIQLHAEYTSPEVLSCDNARIYVDATVRFRSIPAYQETGKAVAEDALMEQVSCDPVDSHYECVLPWLSGVRADASVSHDISLYSENFSNPLHPFGELQVGCERREGGQFYDCQLPTWTGDGSATTTYRRSFPRAVTVATRAVDWSLELDEFSVGMTSDLPHCPLQEHLSGYIRPVVQRRLDAFRSRLDTILEVALGDSFTADFDIPADDLVACGSPESGQDHLECQWRDQFGGERHRCSSVQNSAGQFVCDGAHIEIRRMMVRPEGVEIVLAESVEDPQFQLLDGRPGLIVDDPSDPSDLASTLETIDAQAAPSLEWAFDPDPGLCAPNRWESDSNWPIGQPRGIMRWHASTLLVPSLPICSNSDPACSGICGQFGNECNRVATLGLDELLTGQRLPSGTLSCVNGTCSPP